MNLLTKNRNRLTHIKQIYGFQREQKRMDVSALFVEKTLFAVLDCLSRYSVILALSCLTLCDPMD